MILSGKTVVVSGVGPGLGGHVAEFVVRDGGNAVIGARRADKLADAAAQIDPSGEHIAHLATDIGDPAQTDALAALAVERFGQLDAVVQVAARDHLGTLATSELDDWKKVLETNVIGTMQLVRSTTDLMGDQGGAVVIVGSQSAVSPPVIDQLPYAASKGALRSASLQLAHELGSRKIRVNTLSPTWMWGPPVQGYVQWQAGERGISEDEIVAEITANMCLDEIPADDDVAEMAVFLCSDRARMVTGQTIYVNAGEFMN